MSSITVETVIIVIISGVFVILAITTLILASLCSVNIMKKINAAGKSTNMKENEDKSILEHRIYDEINAVDKSDPLLSQNAAYGELYKQ